jgi:hypothetical protein
MYSIDATCVGMNTMEDNHTLEWFGEPIEAINKSKLH